jgi:glyoxylase-like metal-dependent hydrolase (beta-lactamase superfamily II)
MFTIKSFTFNPFQENTYILHDETRECIIVDPGCYEAVERKELSDYITSNALQVKLLLNTHCHIDHVLGNAFVKEQYKLSLLLHKIEEPYLRAVEVYASNYGFYQYESSKPDGYIDENDTIEFGNQSLNIRFVPGHSPGHIAFYHADSRSLISGDVLFYGSIGRTDLPGGNYEALIESIHKQLFTLPDDVTVYPGHGTETSIGFEKVNNPFCALSINR